MFLLPPRLARPLVLAGTCVVAACAIAPLQPDLTAQAPSLQGYGTAAPGLTTLLRSPLTEPAGAEVIAALGEAMVSARRSAPPAPRGVRGLWKTVRSAAKDPDVTRGVVYLLEMARIFGRRV